MTPLVLFALAGCLAAGSGSDRIVAADLVPAWPEIAGIPADTSIGFAPAPGVSRVLRTIELRRLAERFQIAPPAAGEICVERPAAPLDPRRLLEAMQSTIPGARIEVLDWLRSPIPAGPVEFPRNGLHPAGANGLWAGYVRYAGNRRFAIWARVKISEIVPRVVAAEDLKPNVVAEASRLRLEEREEFPGAGGFAGSIADVAGRVVRRAVRAGEPIRTQWIEAPKEVLRGDTVRVDVQSGSAHLEFEAVAQGSGSAGQTVSVLNPLNNRRFAARVDGKGRVAVVKGSL